MILHDCSLKRFRYSAGHILERLLGQARVQNDTAAADDFNHPYSKIRRVSQTLFDSPM
jgi:hypothetical protein